MLAQRPGNRKMPKMINGVVSKPTPKATSASCLVANLRRPTLYPLTCCCVASATATPGNAARRPGVGTSCLFGFILLATDNPSVNLVRGDPTFQYPAPSWCSHYFMHLLTKGMTVRFREIFRMAGVGRKRQFARNLGSCRSVETLACSTGCSKAHCRNHATGQEQTVTWMPQSGRSSIVRSNAQSLLLTG